MTGLLWGGPALGSRGTLLRPVPPAPYWRKQMLLDVLLALLVSGAMVTVKNKRGMDIHRALTPTTVTLDASTGFFSPARYTFIFEKDGYNSTSASLSAGLDGWYIGNILFGGLIGMVIVDPATGAMWRLGDTVYGNLSTSSVRSLRDAASPISPIAPKPKADVAEELKKLKELKDQGILTEEEYETKRKALVEKL